MQPGSNHAGRKLTIFIWRYLCPCGKNHVVIYGSDEDTAEENARDIWKACDDVAHAITRRKRYDYAIDKLPASFNIDDVPW